MIIMQVSSPEGEEQGEVKKIQSLITISVKKNVIVSAYMQDVSENSFLLGFMKASVFFYNAGQALSQADLGHISQFFLGQS